MAGVNEHYIPRLLQRGFLTSSPGEKTFRIDRTSARELPIRNIASADYFYSESYGSKELDDKFTEFENSIGNIFAQWRKSKGEIVDPDLAAKIIMVLNNRTKNVRDLLRICINLVIEAISKEFSNPIRLRKRIMNELRNSSSEIRAKIKQEIVLMGVGPTSAKQFEEIFLEMAGQRIDSLIEQFHAVLPVFVNMMMSNVDNSSASAQVKLISQFQDDSKRESDLRGMKWKIVHLMNEIILPDCVVVALSPFGRGAPYLFWDKDEAPIVAMPVSSRNILIGGDDKDFRYNRLNKELAKCALEFFLSRSNDFYFYEYASYIGDFINSYAKNLERLFIQSGFRG